MGHLQAIPSKNIDQIKDIWIKCMLKHQVDDEFQVVGMASCFAVIAWTPLSKPNSTSPVGKRCNSISIQQNSTGFPTFSRGRRCNRRVLCSGGKHNESSNLSASNVRWVDVEAGAPRDYREDDFIVVNFYHFVFIQDPEEEVSKHLSFVQGLNLCGRIYLNKQGINAQYSGPAKDAFAYTEWVKTDNRFSDILVQISPARNGHAFPRLKLRYKPSLVQLEEDFSHLPLLDPSMRAMPLMPSEWRSQLELLNKVDYSLSTVQTILLDVRNGYEWDIGHFMGAQRPNVDCFRSTSFGLSESEDEASDPLADVDKENTDILMYCTGGIRCDVYSTILRQRGFKRLFTLKGGVSHYLKNEGPIGWVGNLFVFDSRLSLPPCTFKSENITEASGGQKLRHSFAKCYVCSSQVSELRHRNCANLDCNLLFLCCLRCVDDLRGCCCTACTSAARLRPVLPGDQRYQKWHTYRDLEVQERRM